MSDAETTRKTRKFGPVAVVFAVVVGAAVGTVAGVGFASTGEEAPSTETPTVSCITYETETGNASGMCFTTGNVEFRWLDDDDVQNWTTNGSVDLDGLPENNSTVRRPE